MARTISEKQLSQILKQPGYAIVGEEALKPKQSLAALLPQGSKWEIKFMTLWELCKGPKLEREYKFCPSRKWRADFAHAIAMVLVEVEGGTRSGGRHVRHEGYKADCEKYTEASKLGYVVFRLTSDMITIDKIEEIRDFIFSRT